MRKRTLVASLGAAGALTLTGIGVAIAEPTETPTPSPSTTAPDEDTSATDEDTGTGVDDRRQAIEQALEGLVEDGTLTQDQVGAVAEELDDSPGHWWWGWGDHDHGTWDGLDADFDAGWAAAAGALGMTVDELETALEDGKSLADVAAEKGVDTQAVTDALVGAANTRIDERLADGSLTQEQADELKAEMSDWVAAAVDNDWWSHWGNHHD